MFAFDPLIPDQWPTFDEILMFSPFSSSSSLSSTSPSAQSDPLPSTFPAIDLASMPVPQSRTPPRNKNPNHIPRPRNAFMLFRSAFAAAQKVTPKIEHDNRHITRIIAHCWNHLPEADKQVWRDKAAVEKAQHAQRYPNYRFSPVGRTKKPKKRKVRRNSDKDVDRCLTVANLVMSGKCGSDLELAMREVEVDHDAKSDVFTSDEKFTTFFVLDPPPKGPESDNVPPFRSPLLPPAKITPQQVTEPLVVTTAYPVQPQTSSTGADDLKPLFYQYYQPIETPSPPSIPAQSHYQSVITFVQNNSTEPKQSTDFSIFTWNPSGSYY